MEVAGLKVESKEQRDRIMDAFESEEAHQEWLRQRYVEFVVNHEVAQIPLDIERQMAEKKAEVIDALPGPPQQGDPGESVPTIDDAPLPEIIGGDPSMEIPDSAADPA